MSLGHAVGLLVLLAPTSAWAGGGHYRLQLVRAEGAASCASAAAVERDVTSRLGRNPFSPDGERGIEIVVERAEPLWRARLYLRLDPREPDQVRLLESDAVACDQVSKAVALSVALAITPELSPEPEPEPACPVCPPPPSLPPPPPPPAVHAAVSMRGLYAPELLPATSAGAALAISVRGSLFGASFGGLFFPENQLDAATARLGVGLSAAFAAGCLWARTADPQLWSCLGGRVGALHTAVYYPAPRDPGDYAWAAATTELGLRQHLFASAFVEAGVMAMFPLVRHRFQVDAGTSPIYEQGSALVEGFVGLGVDLD